jgi:20S proteasome alpha/beta subunit
MTLAVTVVCQDGVVVAADSRTTLANHRMLRVGSDYTHKVFESGRVAIATYGEAFVLGRSVASHMAEFAARESGNCDHPGPTAIRLAEFVGDRYDADVTEALDVSEPRVAELGFLVGGYDDAGVGEAWEVTLPDRTVELIATTTDGGGAVWRGQSDVVTRIMRGSDIELLERLATAHKVVDELDALGPLLDACGYRIPFESMNLQDGIDLAVLCIRTTIDVQRLTLGPVATSPEFSWPGVGGPIEIATVTASQGFRWVQRTLLQGERPAGVAEGQA